MALAYDHTKIEKKWQDYWRENKSFRPSDDTGKPKYYVLDMFPYPSGDGLHVGHPEGYIASDIMARYKRMKGFNVLHPMGWDAFGLPTENYARKTGMHPREITATNTGRFRKQLDMLGLSYDWDREINTTDPGYYRWTQWIFLKLFEKGLAYESDMPVWWCPKLKTVLANEEVVDGVSEVGGHPVERRPLKQWMLKITAYADRLLDDLEGLDWPENIKDMQRNWIGRSEGAEVVFQFADSEESLKVFTTRPDTLFGATYMVLAPEHPLVDKLVSSQKLQEVNDYRQEAARKSDLERTDLAKDKTGVDLGIKAVNPVNGQEIPVWISDYVLLSYGTGAIMAVPGHDQRDWEFAKQFSLPIVEVISGGAIEKEAYSGDGVLVNSGMIDGLAVEAAKKKITAWLAEKGLGKAAINYKLRDWLFSRQHYWGEPFPLLHTEDGGVEALPEESLPLELPEIESYEPSEDGRSPLAKVTEWMEVTDSKGKPALREANTMPQWAGSSWYYLR